MNKLANKLAFEALSHNMLYGGHPDGAYYYVSRGMEIPESSKPGYFLERFKRKNPDADIKSLKNEDFQSTDDKALVRYYLGPKSTDFWRTKMFVMNRKKFD